MLAEPVLVRHRLTREDVAALARLVRRSELWVLTAWVLVAGGSVAVLAVLGVGQGYLVAIVSVAVAALAAALLRVARERRRLVGRELVIAFAPDGVTYEWDDQSGHLPWPGLEVQHDMGLLVVRRGGRPLLAVPERYLADADLARVVAWSGGTDDVAGSEIGTPDVVLETPDGGVVVRGVLTPSRARAGGYGMVRRSVWWTGSAVYVVALVLAWGQAMPGLVAGRSVPVPTVLLTVAGGVLSLLTVAGHVRAVREARRLGGRPVKWGFSAAGEDRRSPCSWGRCPPSSGGGCSTGSGRRPGAASTGPREDPAAHRRGPLRLRYSSARTPRVAVSS